MIWPPQMISRDLVLMAGHFSAASAESQSTTNSWPSPRDRCRLVKRAGGEILLRLGARRHVPLALGDIDMKAPPRFAACPQGQYLSAAVALCHQHEPRHPVFPALADLVGHRGGWRGLRAAAVRPPCVASSPPLGCSWGEEMPERKSGWRCITGPLMVCRLVRSHRLVLHRQRPIVRSYRAVMRTRDRILCFVSPFFKHRRSSLEFRRVGHVSAPHPLVRPPPSNMIYPRQKVADRG
jgi:hypothetical protein